MTSGDGMDPAAFMRWALGQASEMEDPEDRKWLLDLLEKAFTMGRVGKNVYHLTRLRSSIMRALDAELRTALEHERQWQQLTPEERQAHQIAARAERAAKKAQLAQNSARSFTKPPT